MPEKVIIGIQEIPKKFSTVWKFHNFSNTKILREINLWDSTSARSAKSVGFAILVALK